MPDIAQLLGSPPCPYGCSNMVLKTDRDKARGYCEFCAMTRFRTPPTWPKGAEGLGIWKHRPRQTFRSEAETYDEGLHDDD